METETTRPATFKQRMALYKFTRINNKGVDIDFDTAKSLLSRAFDGEDIVDDVQELVGRTPNEKQREVKQEAHTVGISEVIEKAEMAATEAANKVPESLPCGFSTVQISPARGPLVTYLKKAGKGYHSSSAMQRGWHITPRLMTQSLDRKQAWTAAYATVLRFYFPDLNITTTSRLD